jgi:predicted enzyme involved in methoxymalonyl-ACP biosynthesis
MERLQMEISTLQDAKNQPPKKNVSITIAATFTADPLRQPLSFWMQIVDIVADVTIAPYAQILQQLLDPESALARNETGINILLIRLEDWIRDLLQEDVEERAIQHLRGVTDEFLAALASLRSRTNATTFVVLCPVSSTLPSVFRESIGDLERKIL